MDYGSPGDCGTLSEVPRLLSGDLYHVINLAHTALLWAKRASIDANYSIYIQTTKRLLMRHNGQYGPAFPAALLHSGRK